MVAQSTEPVLVASPRGKLSRVVLRDQIREVILERVLDGTYAPGTRLVETQVAKEFGTSQAPVREALRDLEALRLVQSQPFRGTHVRALETRELLEVYPVRAVLEEMAAQQATVALRGAVGPLKECLEAMRSAAVAGDSRREIQYDVQFHQLIAGNSVLLRVWHSLAIEARTMITIIAGSVSNTELAELHVPILDAIERQDAVEAGARARQHFEYFGERLRSRLGGAELALGSSHSDPAP
jgi:DNA-binding GntR family transcriptional regulator